MKDLIDESRRRLTWATWATLIATVLLAAALGKAWFSPEADKKPGQQTGVQTDSGTVELEGAAPEVTQGTLVIVACPTKAAGS